MNIKDPIIYDDKINISNFIFLIKNNFKTLCKFGMFGILTFSAFFFLKSNSYVSTFTFYTNYVDEKQLSLGSSILDRFNDSSNSLLKFSISDYIYSDKLLKEIVEQEYIFNDKKLTLVELWGNDYNNLLTLNPLKLIFQINTILKFPADLSESEKKQYIAKKYLSERISYNENKDTRLAVVSVRIKGDSKLPKQIADNIYSSIISYSNEINNNKASEKRKFIEGRLKEVQMNLFKAEDQLVLFTTNNKNLNSSPNLLIQKGRIERDISLHSQLFISLSDQIELAKIDEKNNTNSIFALDKAKNPQIKYGWSFIKGNLYMFIFSFFVGLTSGIIKNRKKLFKF